MQNAITSLVFLLVLITNLPLFSQTSAKDVFEKGNSLFEQKQFSKAIDYFDLAISKDPTNAKAVYNRSLAFYELGKYRKALADLDQFMALYPEDLEASEQRGNLRFLLNDYKGSIEDYNKTLRKDPSNVVYVNRACAKLSLRNYGDALEDIEEALALNPNDIEAHINKADIFFETKQYAKALEIYDYTLNLSPKDSRILNNRGNCYFEMGALEKSMTDYNQAITVAAESGSYVNRGYLHIDRKSAEEAFADCTQATLTDPTNSDAFNCIGLSKQMTGKTKEAMLNFDKAIALEARPDYFINRGKLYLNLGNIEDALRDFNMVKGKKEDHPELNSLITEARETIAANEIEEEVDEDDDYLDDSPADNVIEKTRQYDHKGAKAVFAANVVKVNPGEDNFLDKAFELNERGLYKEALDLFNKVIQHDKKNAQAYHGRGIANSHLNNFEEAIRDFTHAIQLDGEMLAALYNRGILNFDQKKYELARRDFAAILTRNTDFGNAATLWQECDLKLLSLR